MYVAFIVISCGILVSGQTGTETIPLQPNYVQSTTQAAVTPEPAHCLSVNKFNKFEGRCLNRVRCDYGTPAIDLTLYILKGYKRPCSADKVCCPIKYIIPDTPPKDGTNRNGDDSDESNLSDY